MNFVKQNVTNVSVKPVVYRSLLWSTTLSYYVWYLTPRYRAFPLSHKWWAEICSHFERARETARMRHYTSSAAIVATFFFGKISTYRMNASRITMIYLKLMSFSKGPIVSIAIRSIGLRVDETRQIPESLYVSLACCDKCHNSTYWRQWLRHHTLR